MNDKRLPESSVYRLALRAFSQETRRAHGADMVRQFEAERARVSGRPHAIAWLWTRGAADALWNGLLDRCAPHPSVSRRSWSDIMTTDLRYAFRRLAANPAFTSVIVLTLALGIGANSAIFSVVHGVLFEPLPYPESDRLVGVFHLADGHRTTMSPPNFVDVQKTATSFDAVGAYFRSRYTLTGAGEPVQLAAARVSRDYFNVFRLPAEIGRTFTADENTPGRTSVAVLSHALWRRRFGGDPSLVNKTITLDGRSYTVVGVMPAAFAWPLRAELWTPAEYDDGFTTKDRGAWYVWGVARLKRGVDVKTADAEVVTIASQLAKQYPDNTGLSFAAFPLLESLVGRTRQALLVLLSAVGFVLLIACANVANLLLARAAARENELAVRAALGAGRARLIRQLLTESLVLASIGGAAGLALAAWLTRALVALRPTQIPRFENIHIDWTVLVFTAAATLLTGLLFGLMPAFQAARSSLSEVLRERGRSASSGRRGQQIRGALVVAEMALAVLLLSGAGLLIRSFVRLSDVDPGFTVGRALTFSFALPDTKYKNSDQMTSFYHRATARLRALPGVTDVGSITAVPPASFNMNFSFGVRGRPDAKPGEEPSLEVRVADAGYFHVMGIPVRQGRVFTTDDRRGSPPVLVLSESAARKHFPAGDAVGQHITLGWRVGTDVVGGDVIGVVGDVKSFGLDQEAPPQVYALMDQVTLDAMAFVVRTAVPPETLLASVPGAIAELDPNIPVNSLETLDTHVASSIAERRFYMLLLALFAGVALALAAVGIFGVLSYLVAQRTREIGIRVALGARRTVVVGMVLRQAVTLAGVGVVAGLTATIGLAGVMQSLVFDLSPTDPLTLVLVGITLMVVATVAAYVPVRRAAAVDPMVALRDV